MKAYIYILYRRNILGEDKLKIEISRFSDKRLMLLVRFFKGSNFRESDNESSTWVPKKEELQDLTEAMEAIDFYNIVKKEKRKNFSSPSA
jgi:hypothetical protein